MRDSNKGPVYSLLDAYIANTKMQGFISWKN